MKIFEKIIFTGNCSCDLKITSVKKFLHFRAWISAGNLLNIEMHCFERGRTLNLFCRGYKGQAESIYSCEIMYNVCDIICHVSSHHTCALYVFLSFEMIVWHMIRDFQIFRRF